ncbi:DNA-binding response regulator [Streptomyces tauricus]|uniref:Response regulator transcription factor n=1 Tax=Streptomyces tauricus TaxID=68274 RepID=A0ABZ1JWR1_9ACTN|nr:MULTISPECIES: response regulator transcription factor [Streptomyces]MCW8096133.1 response regulator transcription factor [Streptomyces tauricus]UPZ33396.1 response regulator transcription factor [Streptomyces sp. LRE541]GHA06037.1 DNA-binding response regulator [Streptomyces tauricus]
MRDDWPASPAHHAAPGGGAGRGIRVLLCCEGSIVGAGMRALLDQQPDIAVIGYSTGTDSEAAAADSAPDVTVVVAPALTIENKRELTALAALTKVIHITKAENASRSIEILRLGVRAVLAPDTSADELIHVLRTVSAGSAMVIPEAARRSLDHLPQRHASALAASVVPSLTPRETEVIVLLTQGKSNAEIAEKLSVSTATVRSHVHHLLRKLGVGSRAQAVAVAYETGLMAAIEQNSKDAGRS